MPHTIHSINQNHRILCNSFNLVSYLEYPLITWRNPFFATYFLLSESSSRSYFNSGRSTNCLPDHLSNHQIWYFKSKSPYAIDLFFLPKNVISRVFSQAHNITWPFFLKTHQINKFVFLNCQRGLIFLFLLNIFYLNYWKVIDIL